MFDFESEHAKVTAAYTNPLTVAEKIARDYKSIPEQQLRLTDMDEYWERREAARQLRIVRADEMADDPRHDLF